MPDLGASGPFLLLSRALLLLLMMLLLLLLIPVLLLLKILRPLPPLGTIWPACFCRDH